MNLKRRKLRFSDDEDEQISHDDSSGNTPKHCSKCVTSSPPLELSKPENSSENEFSKQKSPQPVAQSIYQKKKSFEPFSTNSNKYASGRFDLFQNKPINNFNQTWTKPSNTSLKIIKKNISSPIDFTKSLKPKNKRTFVDNLPLNAMGAAGLGLVGYETYKWLKRRQKFDVGTQKNVKITQPGRDLNALLLQIDNENELRIINQRQEEYGREYADIMERLRERGITPDPGTNLDQLRILDHHRPL
jgi:hypothetical protein